MEPVTREKLLSQRQMLADEIPGALACKPLSVVWDLIQAKLTEIAAIDQEIAARGEAENVHLDDSDS